MTIDTRPTTSGTFKKNFNKPIDLSAENYAKPSSLERNFKYIYK